MNKINDFSFSPFGGKIIISNDYGICSIRKTPFNNTLSVRTKDNNFIYSPDYFFTLPINPNQTTANYQIS